MRQLTSGVIADGEVVWSWRPKSWRHVQATLKSVACGNGGKR